MSALTEIAARTDVRGVDAFTPLVALWGASSRALGSNPFTFVWSGFLLEVLFNTMRKHPESSANIAADLVSGFGGWLAMDAYMRSNGR